MIFMYITYSNYSILAGLDGNIPEIIPMIPFTRKLANCPRPSSTRWFPQSSYHLQAGSQTAVSI